MVSDYCRNVIDIMKQGCYFDYVMSAGSELDRVKQFLRAMAGQIELPRPHKLQYPTYPCFPGLSHQPFHDRGNFPGVKILEDNIGLIRQELAGLRRQYYADYSPRGKNIMIGSGENLLSERPIENWSLYLLYYVGVDIDFENRFPETKTLIRALPNVCLDYPWGDALFSLHAPGAHLPAHCSIDNLRVRTHLGIEIPDESAIRVGVEERRWKAGECLVFEDSFEHEVWNRADSSRLVLIVDFWHPDLTKAEQEVLTAGFLKSDVRLSFYKYRLSNTTVPKDYYPLVEKIIMDQDEDEVIRKYWS